MLHSSSLSLSAPTSLDSSLLVCMSLSSEDKDSLLLRGGERDLLEQHERRCSSSGPSSAPWSPPDTKASEDARLGGGRLHPALAEVVEIEVLLHLVLADPRVCVAEVKARPGRQQICRRSWTGATLILVMGIDTYRSSSL